MDGDWRLRDREYLSLEQLVSVLSSANDRFAGDFIGVLRSVSVRDNRGEWQNFATILRLYDREYMPLGKDRDLTVDFRSVRLRSWSVDQKAIANFSNLRASLTTWRSEAASTQEADWQETVRAERSPSRRGGAAHPVWTFELHETTRTSFEGTPDGPFVNVQHGIFAERVGPLAAAWLNDVSFANESHVRNKYQVIIPDLRGWIDVIEADDEAVYVRAQGRARNLPLLCGAYADSLTADWMSDLVPLTDQRAVLTFPRQPKSLNLWLVTEDGEWLDRYEESPYGASWGEGILLGGRGRDVNMVELAETLRAGEGPTLEYKEWIPAREQKEKSAEFLRNLIAFSNLSGGDILIGVNDHGEVIRIQPELARTYKEEAAGGLARMQDAYVRDLKKMVTDRIAPKVLPDFLWVDFGGLPVLRVRVERGGEPPYLLLDTNDIYIRAGATNRKAHPAELRALFGKPEEGRSTFFRR